MEEFYTFTSGELNKEEYNAFIQKLGKHIDLDRGIVLILSPQDDSDEQFFSNLKARQKGDCSGRKILYYKSKDDVVVDLWSLLDMADVEFLFSFSGTYESLIEKLEATLGKAHKEYREKMDSLSWWHKFFHSQDIPSLDLNPFIKQFAPVFWNRCLDFSICNP